MEGFDEIVSGSLKKFLDLSATIGGDVKKQADLVAAAFQAQRDFLGVVSKSKAPNQVCSMLFFSKITCLVCFLIHFGACRRAWWLCLARPAKPSATFRFFGTFACVWYLDVFRFLLEFCVFTNPFHSRASAMLTVARRNSTI